MEPKDPNEFMNRLKLKEALYLMSQGEEADSPTVDRILKTVLPEESPTIQICLQFVNDKLKVLSSELLEMSLFSPELAFRGEGNASGGAFRVHRQVGVGIWTLSSNPVLKKTRFSFRLRHPTATVSLPSYS